MAADGDGFGTAGDPDVEMAARAQEGGVGDLAGLGSVTVHVQDINRDRGYSTTAERKKKRANVPRLGE